MIGRRDLLVRSGLVLAAAGLGSLLDTPRTGARGVPAAVEPGELRDAFDLSPDLIHMGLLYLASHPRSVRDAIERHRRGLDADPVGYVQTNGARLEAAVLRSAADYLGVGPTEIALTDSTTMGLGLLYNGLALRSDQEILTSTHDFFATHEALRFRTARTGASYREVRLYRDGASATADEIVDAVAAALTPRTRIVALTWVHSSTGIKLPLGRIGEVVAAANDGRSDEDRALLCVDGVHALGVEEASPAELGVDFFVAGCHKWLFGPRGTGIVWGRADAWPAATPTIASFSNRRTPGGAFTPGGFHSFEHRWALGEAFDLHTGLGKSQVAAHVRALSLRLKEGLATIPGVRLRTPMAEELSAGITCFEIAGVPPRAAVARLRARGIVATTTPYTPTYARLAPGLLNTLDEVDAVLRAVRALA